MIVAGQTALGILAVAGLLCVVRLARPGGSVADRAVALDTLLTITVTGVAVYAVMTGARAFIDLLVVAALVGFVGTVTVARFMERRGA
jgi:multicomponent Na+:H+ antiporter subunit F